MSEAAGKLKIGLVSPYAWTSRWGVNRHIAGLASSLGLLGHDVSVIAPSEERLEARTARRRARAARRTIKGARKLAPAGQSLATRGGAGAETAGSSSFVLIKIAGTYRVPYSQSLANLALPLEVTEQLNELLEDERFDILHVHEPYPPSLSFTALRLTHCPTVATFHTSGERFLSYQLMRPVVERFFARLDGRICTSHNTRRMVSSYFPGQYSVIGGGVDTSVFSPPESFDESEPRVIFAAWSDPRKGLGLLARTIRLLPDDVPHFELQIVGGEELAWRGRLLIPRRLRERIRWGGTIGQTQLAAQYRKADVLCAPYAASGLASSVLEAMASGVAVIVPGQGGIKELVSEGGEGLLLDHPYSYNLAASMVDLLHDEKERRSLGATAARKASRYSWDKITPRVERTYLTAHRRRRRVQPPRGALETISGSDKILADLHMHTNSSSDCATTPEELIAASLESGLEAIAITDHNTIAGALEVKKLAPDSLHVIVGEEIKTKQGEIIGLYLTDEIPKGLSAEETIARIKEQGGLVYVPHPFDPLHLTPTYELLASKAADIDILEVYNPRITFTTFNEKARRLARKYDIPGAAGSDCHIIQGIGTAMISLRKFSTPIELLTSLREADIIRGNKSPLYLHSMKLLKNSRGTAGLGRR